MPRKDVKLLILVAVVAALLPGGCGGQKSGETQVAEEAPPMSQEPAGMDEAIPEPPKAEAAPPKPAERSAERPSRARAVESIPEERPRRLAPEPAPAPAAVTVTIPAGTSFAVSFTEPLTSATAMVGDRVVARLESPMVVGDRVAFPADSRVEGKITDVKSARKGFKDTGGAMAISFNRIVAPGGRSATIVAGFTKVAEGSAGKKAAIIGGSAVGGALLGKVLGKDEKGAAILGGAIGTAVAGGTKGKEATIAPDEVVTVALEQAARTTMNR
jgi:hypothetical protein